jgi:hypothetical protein
MSDGETTNGRRAAHALDGINAHEVLGTTTRSTSRPLAHHRFRGRYSRPESSPGSPGKAGNYGRSRRA